MYTSRRALLKGFAGVPALLAATYVPFSAIAQEGGGGDHAALRVAMAKPAGSLDPHKYIGLWSVQDLIFEPLIRYGHGGKMEPALATEWTLEDGGKLFRLKLRQNVMFQDGEPWNAQAMTWNLDRWMGKDAHNWMNASRLFDGYNIIDDYTVEIKFKEPVLGLLYEFSYVRPSRFLSPKSVDAQGNYQKPVGTGPWMEESASNSSSTFMRYDGYWGERPAFEHVDLMVLPDSRSRMAALRANEIDLIGGDFLAPIKATEAKTLKDAGVPVVVETGTMTMILGFNPDRNEALKDQKVRKAIDIGFDRTAISQVLFYGMAEPAANLFPSTVPFSGKRFEISTRNVEAAAALLEQAGWIGTGIREKDGKKLQLELVVSEEAMAGSRALGEILQAQLGEIGIGITIRSVDHASRHSDIPARKFDMALFYTLGAPYEPFGTLIGMLLSTFNNGVDGKLALDPVNLDPLLLAATSASDDKVEAETQKVYDWLHDNVALLPLFYAPVIWAHSDKVSGFKAPATEYDLPFENVTLGS
jgi:nickel transport system substrate-binding protein